MKKLKPVLDGDWWQIGPSPDLRGVLPGAEDHKAAWEANEKKGEHNAPVDHHIFQGPDGKFHLWGCVRATAVGRILYHWEADSLTDSPWRATGELLHRDQSAGECIVDLWDREWIQSPYFVVEDGTYYMFIGGASTDIVRPDGEKEVRDWQISLLTSTDGRTWTRYKNAEGLSRMFAGPGEARDPCLIKIGDLWYCYYVGYEGHGETNHGFCVRTSKDLLNWSDYKIVHHDSQYGTHHCSCECPHVVFREGYFYLFRTVNYYKSITHVFRSDNPLDFGVGDATDKHVGIFPTGAPELYEFDGQEYVSSNHNPPLGTQMCKMRWVEDN